MRVSKKLLKPTMSMSGSLGGSIAGNFNSMLILAAPSNSSVDPWLKLHIHKNLFAPFEVLVAADQGKSIHHYLEDPLLTPFNDPKLRVFHSKLNFDTWSEGLNIYMIIWTEIHPEDAIPLMQYTLMIHSMAKVFPPVV